MDTNFPAFLGVISGVLNEVPKNNNILMHIGVSLNADVCIHLMSLNEKRTAAFCENADVHL